MSWVLTSLVTDLDPAFHPVCHESVFGGTT